MKTVVYGLLFFLAATVIAAPPAAAKAPAIKVVTETTKATSNTEVRRYVGHVTAYKSVSFPARVSGILQKIHFVEGDIVQQGQLLFEIEDVTYRAKAEQAAAQVKQAEAQLEFAKVDYQRQKDLRATKAVSQAVFEEAERTLRTAEASLANAKAVKLDADNTLSYCKVYAPFTGLIGKAAYSTGNYVTPSSKALADMVQLSPIYVCFALSERDYLDMFGDYKTMRKDGRVQYRLADGKAYDKEGFIRLMDNRVDTSTGTITAWSVVDNPKNQLIPGGFATAMLSNKNAPVMVSVKLSAVMANNKGNYVYVLDKDNKVQLRYVKLANVVNGRQFIASGLEAGETVVTDGTNRVRPGDTAMPMFTGKEPQK